MKTIDLGQCPFVVYDEESATQSFYFTWDGKKYVPSIQYLDLQGRQQTVMLGCLTPNEARKVGQ